MLEGLKHQGPFAPLATSNDNERHPSCTGKSMPVRFRNAASIFLRPLPNAVEAAASVSNDVASS
jgi:hypothetical protein